LVNLHHQLLTTRISEAVNMDTPGSIVRGAALISPGSLLPQQRVYGTMAVDLACRQCAQKLHFISNQSDVSSW